MDSPDPSSETQDAESGDDVSVPMVEPSVGTDDVDLEPEPAAVVALPGSAATSEDVVEQTEPALLPRPYPGTGQITGGSMLIGAGAFGIVFGSIALAASFDEGGNNHAAPLVRGAGGVLLATGIVFAGAGSGLLYGGIQDRRAYRRWSSRGGHSLPISGNGMIVGGSVLGGLGLLTVWRNPAVGAVGLVAGGALLGVGISFHRKFKRGLLERGFTLSPTYNRGTRMAGLSMTGRF